MPPLHHMIKHHRYLRHRTSHIDEAKHQEIEKNFPRCRHPVILIDQLVSSEQIFFCSHISFICGTQIFPEEFMFRYHRTVRYTESFSVSVDKPERLSSRISPQRLQRRRVS